MIIEKKWIYLTLIVSVVVLGSMFYFFTENAGKLGFQQGYVCAYEHYSYVDSNALDLDDYTPSKYCEAFSKLFDFYAEPLSVSVNAGVPLDQLTAEGKRKNKEIAQGVINQ